jgi:hypothetical protein
MHRSAKRSVRHQAVRVGRPKENLWLQCGSDREGQSELTQTPLVLGPPDRGQVAMIVDRREGGA